jgi:hypothetical protein
LRTLSYLGIHLLLENCLDVTVNLCSSTRRFSQGFSANIADYLIDSVAEDKLFVATFLTFNP